MNRPLGLAAAALTGLQVGLAIVATRALADQIGPMTLAFLRYAVGCVVLFPFFLRLRPAPLAKPDRVPVLLLGVAQFGLLIALLNAGLGRVTAAQGAVLFSTFPLLTMLLGTVLGIERLSPLRLVGAGLSVVGIAICLGAGTLPGSVSGIALVLSAALCGAVCAVFYRPYLQRYPTLQIGTLAMFAAVVALIPGSMFESPLQTLVFLPGLSWALVVFIGLSSGVGYLLWLTALKHAAPSEATILLGLSPIAATLTGWFWLAEPLTPGFAVGLVLALAGVTLAVLVRR